MSLDGRLNKLTGALSARERGILLLKSLKGELEEDPAWRASMPRDQRADFNRYIALINTANVHVAHLVTFVEKEVEKVELLMSWLLTLRLWQASLAEIAFCASVLAREPVTEEEHRRLVEEASAQYLTLAQAGRHVAEVLHRWTDDDLEEALGVKDLVVKDEAMERLCREAQDEVRQAVAAGEVEARGRGSGLRVRFGSLEEWLGREPRAYPEWAGGYEVRPGGLLVDQDRRLLEHLRRATSEARFAEVEGESIDLDTLIETLEARLRNLIPLRWRDARTAETVLEKVAREFEGEDPSEARYA
jgi:hypothetical protein